MNVVKRIAKLAWGGGHDGKITKPQYLDAVTPLNSKRNFKNRRTTLSFGKEDVIRYFDLRYHEGIFNDWFLQERNADE